LVKDLSVGLRLAPPFPAKGLYTTSELQHADLTVKIVPAGLQALNYSIISNPFAKSQAILQFEWLQL